MWQSLTDVLVDWAYSVIEIFPASPIQPLIQSLTVGPIGTILGVVNYILPVAEIMAVMAIWLTAVTCYYVYQILLRWLRVVE